jgi:hypothetical protein
MAERRALNTLGRLAKHQSGSRPGWRPLRPRKRGNAPGSYHEPGIHCLVSVTFTNFFKTDRLSLVSLVNYRFPAT